MKKRLYKIEQGKKLENGNVLLNFTEEIETNNFIMKLLSKSYLKSQQKRYMRDLEKELKTIVRGDKNE